MLASLAAAEVPTIPVGLDAYRQWERWPYQRIGERSYMRSTYDRKGGNHSADASHFLYALAPDNYVPLDVEGPGVLYFVRTNHWHGSPWRYVVDGHESLVTETSTADPTHPVTGSEFQPAALFPSPLSYTWSTTKGADLMWVPMAFEKSLRLGYSRTHYGTGYYIYHQFVPGTPLSQPLRAWDGQTPPDPAVVELLNRAGTDLAPADARLAAERRVALPPGASTTFGDLRGGPAMVRALELSVPRSAAAAMRRVRLRITWDDRAQPSVDAPVPLFFGAGTLYRREGGDGDLVKALPVNIRFAGDRVLLACWFPMPYQRSGQIALVNEGEQAVPDVEMRVRTLPFAGPMSDVGYLHATYRDHPNPVAGQDLVLLDTAREEGSSTWRGSFIGTSFIFSQRAVLNTLEGDPRFFFDDCQTPSYGTGTEEWGGGGDYWGGRNMTLPFAGHPTGAVSPQSAVSAEDQVESAYRFLLADLMPFGRHAVIQLEHGGENTSTEHYETVTYWYGAPGRSLVQTDTLDVGNAASEAEHGYHSPEASASETISSRYEWGPDTLGGKECYPAHEEDGRHTRGTSEFTLRLDPTNVGVMLRRKLDYAWPNQRAEVALADVGAEPPVWHAAGVWYLAGSNTCVYSNPKGELDPAEPVVWTGNRRFRDDELLLPRALTSGRRAVRVQVRFTPVSRALFPGQPIVESAWSELRYTAECFVPVQRP